MQLTAAAAEAAKPPIVAGGPTGSEGLDDNTILAAAFRLIKRGIGFFHDRMRHACLFAADGHADADGDLPAARSGLRQIRLEAFGQ